jgi:8-hydroxy-5-deazaflavin:NADPH oxidoreductase
MKKIGVLGSGAVGKVLADGFLKHGYQVMLGSREPAKLAAWQTASGGRGSTGTFADAARFGETVVLAVKGTAAEEVVRLVGPDTLSGKTVIDATNPIAEAPPVNGVLRLFTTLDESLLERLQRLAPSARLVKAFSSVGNSLMVNPQLPGGPPTMFICGNDVAAKAEVTAILNQFGWGIEDMGGVEAARAIEPLCILWCIPGFRQNRWRHAFKLLE